MSNLLQLSILLLVILVLFSSKNAIDFKGVLHGFEFNTIHRSALPCGVIKSLDQFCDSPEACSTANLPKEFDCRKKWPDRITEALNQGKCGSCWSFAYTTAASDRIRIKSRIGKNETRFEKNRWSEKVLYDSGQPVLMNTANYPYGQILDNLSPYTFAGCDVCELAENMDPIVKEYFDQKICNYCCDGGILQYACIYGMIKGTITYGSDPEPNDYTCSNYSGEPEFKVKSVYHITGEENIMANILHNGPVIAGYIVNDMFGFEQGKIGNTGIFGKPGRMVGGHAICIMGWGEELYEGRKYKYWLCRNSWGSKWNGDGYFRLLRGENYCGIEEDVWGVTPFEVYDLSRGQPRPKPKMRDCGKNSGGVVSPY